MQYFLYFQQYLAVTHCILEMCGVSAFRYSQKYWIFFLLSSAWSTQCVLNSIFVNPAQRSGGFRGKVCMCCAWSNWIFLYSISKTEQNTCYDSGFSQYGVTWWHVNYNILAIWSSAHGMLGQFRIKITLTNAGFPCFCFYQPLNWNFPIQRSLWWGGWYALY